MTLPPAFPSGYDKQCWDCSSENVGTRYERETFQYGNKQDGIVELSADIPVRFCRDCGAEFTDGEAEDVRQDAVCKHLGRMTPSEIKALRKSYGLSRREFAEATLLGEASLARWENGELTQNAAYDRFLRLLKFPDNMERLRVCQDEESKTTESAPEYQPVAASVKSGGANLAGEEPATRRKKQCSVRASAPRLNADVFKAVLLYILNQVGAKPNVGETVIYKLLYFIDFDHYEKFEQFLTGAVYIKDRHGPTPVDFTRIAREMQEAGEIVKVSNQYFKYQRKKYLPLKEPDLALLNAEQIKHIDGVLSRLSDMSASELSSYSHRDTPWLSAESGEPLEYEAVFYRTEEISVRVYDEA